MQIYQPQHIEAAFNCPPVYNAAFACLSPADIIRAGRTCRLLRDAVAHFQDLAYNINRHLTYFFNDPVAFRRLQAKTKLFISGSNALQFLDRTFYPESDMDIFAYPETAKEIGHHLINKEGYKFQPSENQPKDFDQVVLNPRQTDNLFRGHSQHVFVYSSGMSDLLRFKRPHSDLEVQLISVGRSPLDCLLYFHSTCVMNFITHNAAYSLYPNATFDKRMALSFGHATHEPTAKAYKKYSDRGWAFPSKLGFAEVARMSSFLAPDKTRYLDDPLTWIIPLDTEGLDLDPSSPFDSLSAGNPFHCNSWSLTRVFDGYSREMSFGVTYSIVYRKIFEQTYLVADVLFGDVITQFIDYAQDPDTSLLKSESRGFLDSYIPKLRKAHLTVPKRTYTSSLPS